MVLFGGLGLLLLTQFQTVLPMALYAYSLVGASLTPALLAAFLWKRVTPAGGVACIAGGLGTILGVAVLSRAGWVDFVVRFAGNEFDFLGQQLHRHPRGDRLGHPPRRGEPAHQAVAAQPVGAVLRPGRSQARGRLRRGEAGLTAAARTRVHRTPRLRPPGCIRPVVVARSEGVG
ncbi:MAG: hypothetical protein R2862_12975 [Thermoanaerobaculia bacterium]